MGFQPRFQVSANPSAIRIALAFKSRSEPIDPVVLTPLTKFAQLGAHGGLSGQQFDPTTAEMELLSSRMVSATSAECRLTGRAISPDAVHMLMGAVGFIDARVAELSSVLVECSREMILAHAAPRTGHYEPLPFQLVDERTFESRGFELALDFTTGVSEQVLQQFEYEAYGHWVSAANVGCFASPAFPAAACHVYPAGDPLVSDDRMVLALDNVAVAEPDATASLINVLHWGHRHIHPLARAELYE
jgi:hypothetical protein